MSFSFNHTVKGREHAKDVIANNNQIPDIIKSIVNQGIDGVRFPDDKELIFYMQGNGHIATKDSFQETTINIIIKPIIVE
jgi:hypothetical protein